MMQWSRRRYILRLSSIIIAAIAILSTTSFAAVPCNDTHNPCEESLYKGSRCKNGYCTNPFLGGCLRPLLESEEYAHDDHGVDHHDDDHGVKHEDADRHEALRRRLLSTRRVCNSEDAPDVRARGLCVDNSNEYSEIRISSQNWESAFALSWMIQIIYSELLGVPSTVETGMAEKNVNFYDETNRMEYGKANEYQMFTNAHDAEGDCTVYKGANEGASGEDYIPCAHMVLDVWFPNDSFKSAQKAGHSESMQYVGMIGYQGWHITKFSLEKDPSLATHFGIAGEENRQKLADTFKRPTTWRDYCDLISPSNCTVKDDVATRPPADDGSEDGKYFSRGSYTGYFRATDKNDCTKTEKCTGHFLDYPCGWSSAVKQQIYHLDIALEGDGTDVSGGYAYGEMVDIMFAANATKSDLIGIWWTPEANANELLDSGSELKQVALPTVTQECIENRVDPLMRCDPSATEFDIYGDKNGACGDTALFITKVAAGNLQSSIEESSSSKSRMNPAYDVYKEFTITTLQIDQILTDWVKRGKDKFNFDLRYATCKWMADNLDFIVDTFIPDDHPRTFIVSSKNDAMTIVALIFSAIAIFSVVGALIGIMYLQKRGTLRRAAQIEFLLLLLVGLGLVSVGSLLMALEPSDGTCISSVWMINVGYTAQLVPTLIRVSAIISIVRASLKMRIVRIDKNKLLIRSFLLSAIAAIYCIIWTLMDPPQSETSLDLTQDKNDLGESVVNVSQYCASESAIWYFIMFIGQGFLLICASVLAYQMRAVPNQVNDSKPLAFMIYSSFLFLILRFVVYSIAASFAESSAAKASLEKARSLFCSLDTLTNIFIFFPQFFLPEKRGVARRGSSYDGSGPSVLECNDHSMPRKNIHVSGIQSSALDDSDEPINRNRLQPSIPEVDDFDDNSESVDRENGLESPPGSPRKRNNSTVMLKLNREEEKEEETGSNSDAGFTSFLEFLRDSPSTKSTSGEERAPRQRRKRLTVQLENQPIILPKWVLEQYGEFAAD